MTPEQRRRCMAAIKGKDTKPEMIVRKYLFSRGLRFRVQVRKLPGNPDIVLPKYKTEIQRRFLEIENRAQCCARHPQRSRAESPRLARNPYVGV